MHAVNYTTIIFFSKCHPCSLIALLLILTNFMKHNFLFLRLEKTLKVRNMRLEQEENIVIEQSYLYNNKINARVLIGQSAMVYCAGKPMEKSRVF